MFNFFRSKLFFLNPNTTYNSSTILELYSLKAFFYFKTDIQYKYIIKVTGRYYLEDIENKLKTYREGYDVYLQLQANHNKKSQNTEYYIIKRDILNNFVKDSILLFGKVPTDIEYMFYSYIAHNKLSYMFIGPFPNNIPRGGDKCIITDL